MTASSVVQERRISVPLSTKTPDAMLDVGAATVLKNSSSTSTMVLPFRSLSSTVNEIVAVPGRLP